jgi:ketosteroid isomerase-like protein
MKATKTLMTNVVTFSLVMFSAIIFTSVHAQTAKGKTDEQIIRDLIAQENEGKHVIKLTDNPIFVSGAYPRPIVGKAANEGRSTPAARGRQNFTQKTRIERLTVSRGGDMAYEFGYADLAWDTKDDKHQAFEASYLRTWRKVDGQWKSDVFFARPNEPTDTGKK